MIDNITNLSTIGIPKNAKICSVKAYADNHDYLNILREFPAIIVPQGFTKVYKIYNNSYTSTSYYIETTATPIYEKPNRFAPEKLKAAKKQFKNMAKKYKYSKSADLPRVYGHHH